MRTQWQSETKSYNRKLKQGYSDAGGVFWRLADKLSHDQRRSLIAFYVQRTPAPFDSWFDNWTEQLLTTTALEPSTKEEWIDAFAAVPVPGGDRPVHVEWELEERSGQAIPILAAAFEQAKSREAREAIFLAFDRAFPGWKLYDIMKDQPRFIRDRLAWYKANAPRLKLNPHYPSDLPPFSVPLAMKVQGA